MKYKKYIALFLCAIAIGSYLFFKDKKETAPDAPASTQVSNTSEQNTDTENTTAKSQGGSSNTQSETMPPKLDITLIDTIPNKIGNTYGNLANQGHAAQQGKWMYFTLEGSQIFYPLYRAMGDGETGFKPITANSNIRHINVIGEWIYYYNPRENRIYKIKTNGTEQTVITGAEVQSMIVVRDDAGEWIYYSSYSQGINKIDTEGKNKQSICDGSIICAIDEESDTVYYINGSDSKLYRVNTDGTNKKLVLGVVCSNVIVQGDWIYYINREDNGKIYKIKKNGTGNTNVSDAGASMFNISGDFIYYISYKDSNSLYKLSVNGGGETTFAIIPDSDATDDNYRLFVVLSINIIDDNIFCSCKILNGYSLIRVKNDGSIRRVIVSSGR